MLVKIFGDTLGVPEVEAGRPPPSPPSSFTPRRLLHDDVVDNGMFRRGKPTVNARWGNIVAVMSGDLLLSGALLQLAKFDRRASRSARWPPSPR